MRRDMFPQRLSWINHFVYISGHYGTLWKEVIILLDSSVSVYRVYEKIETDNNSNIGFQRYLDTVLRRLTRTLRAQNLCHMKKQFIYNRG